MGLHKILRIVALLLAVAGIVALAMVLINGNGLDAQLYIAYITLALTLFIVLVYVLKETFSGNLKKTLMSIGAFLLVIIIAYVMSEGVETEMRDGAPAPGGLGEGDDIRIIDGAGCGRVPVAGGGGFSGIGARIRAFIGAGLPRIRRVEAYVNGRRSVGPLAEDVVQNFQF